MELLFTILLLMMTYFTGRLVEFRQFRSLEERESSKTQIPVLNTEEDTYLPHAVRTELVTAHICLSADYFRRFLGGILTLFGGSLHTIESLSDRARREIVLRLQSQAPKASYITGMRMEVMKERPGMIQMLAIATAVYNDHPMAQKPRGYSCVLDHSCNAPRKHPLKELAIYGSITLLLLFLILKGGTYVIDPIAKHIPVETEEWLWRNVELDFQLPKGRPLTPALQQREKELQALLDKLPKSDALASYHFKLTLIDDPTINAVSLPGQRIVLFTGLLDDLSSENALVFILGHEIGHFANRDHVKQLVKLFFDQIISWVLGDTDLSSFTSTMGLQFSREQEKEADLIGLETLVQYYGHAGGATDFFTSQKHKSKEGWLAIIENVAEFFSDHPDDQDRVDYVVEQIEQKGYKINEVSEFHWVQAEPENLSPDELLQKYPYAELDRLNDLFSKRYYDLYERFWDIWVDGTLYQERFTDVWLANVEKAEKRNRQARPYHLAAWKSYVNDYFKAGSIPSSVNGKLDTMVQLINEQYDAELEVLEAHRSALNLLVQHADTWRPLNKNNIKMGYKGGGAEFQEHNKKIRAADAKRYKLWQRRAQVKKELLNELRQFERSR